jgi:hypothetical protein
VSYQRPSTISALQRTFIDGALELLKEDRRVIGIAAAGSYPCPEFQWVEDRFWVWIHYAATKVGRGELFEAADFLSFLRSNVFGPLGKRRLGLRPVGVRRLETDAPQLAADLRGTIAAPERGSILAAINVCVQLYRRLRSAEPRPIEMRDKAEAAALEYLAQLEEGLETNHRTKS